VQLRDQLSKHLSLNSRLPATLMFDHPTIDALASFLRDRLWPPEAPDNLISVSDPASAERGYSTALAGLAAVAAMTDADIEARLLERFKTRQPDKGKNATR
jgi:hypothetical protein